MEKLNAFFLLTFSLLYITTITDAEIISKKYPDGKLHEYYNIKSNEGNSEVKDGKYESWYPSGEKKILANFVNNSITGTLKGWFCNGNLFFELQNDSIIFHSFNNKVNQICLFDKTKSISDWFNKGITLFLYDENDTEADDQLFIVNKDSTLVYKYLSPDSPILYTFNQGDTLEMLGEGNNFAIISIHDTLKGYLFKEYYDSIHRK